jgi:hypothetical protein
MEGIITAVRAVCITAAGICMISHLTEGTKLRHQAEFIYKLVFAMTVAGLFINGCMGLDLPDLSSFESEEYCFSTDIYDKAIAEQTASNINDILLSQLNSAGISVEDIDTEVNISENSGISINRVIIRTAEFEKAAELIRSSLGQETEVINGDS